jgi:hypothetical protein
MPKKRINRFFFSLPQMFAVIFSVIALCPLQPARKTDLYILHDACAELKMEIK